MNRFDFTPYRRSTVGFDRLFDLLENNARAQQSENYPPFNIERSGEDHYRITLAVAGFKDEEIEITAQQNLLLVTGNKNTDENEGKQFLHMGIANRSFERRFELADFVRVDHAALADGLLTIDLVREIPEAMKPQKISINQADNVTKIAHKKEKKEDKAA
ncbi:Hsp20 family protein [Parasphingorhabdus flavimaris]|jgi:molecular chaperone IbpA|uniref:Hsp20 family protein n=1 Tax=Parasphingorhabdus flavimaris TaxID=266812 RepID=A0ABX2N1K3_9SPHN|nr:Hsp20 family protein [Parasphingorhabdus flavimaris]NVD27552.1 Hsp20 family protein [Parasphingorhabdus flavimaris]|tara:strand:+ start:8731 stop:9210 length:480 start_codon:yes stop_codon:yes gene_type:complete